MNIKKSIVSLLAFATFATPLAYAVYGDVLVYVRNSDDTDYVTCLELKPIIERNEAFDVECVTDY